MSQDIVPTASDPARAFEELRSEISLLRCAVEGLTAARDRVPDYTPTLAKIIQWHEATYGGIERIERSPALALSPAATAKEISQAGREVRAEDARTIHEATTALACFVGRLDGMIERGQAAEGQKRLLAWACGATAIFVILIWSVLPGAVARSLPASWHVPEWMAARVMRMDERTAGERLLVIADQRQRRIDRSAPPSVP